MTPRIGRITMKTAQLLRERALEANAIASALYEDGHFAAAHLATDAALQLASAAQALESRLGGRS